MRTLAELKALQTKWRILEQQDRKAQQEKQQNQQLIYFGLGHNAIDQFLAETNEIIKNTPIESYTIKHQFIAFSRSGFCVIKSASQLYWCNEQHYTSLSHALLV